jgi:hypothetical protein
MTLSVCPLYTQQCGAPEYTHTAACAPSWCWDESSILANRRRNPEEEIHDDSRVSEPERNQKKLSRLFSLVIIIK